MKTPFSHVALACGPPSAVAPAPPRERRARAVVGWCCWSYLALVLANWLLLARVGEAWWPVTLLLYWPRWLALTPLVLLVPAALLLRPRMLGVLLVGAAVVLGPVMGLCLPWRTAFGGGPDGKPLRVLSCNTDGARLDAEALGLLITRELPDVVVLQEWKAEHREAVFRYGNYHVEAHEMGLCVGSLYPIRKVEFLGPEELDVQGGALRCDLETPSGVLHVFNVHLPTPRDGFEELFGRRNPSGLRVQTEQMRRASALVRAWVDRVEGPVLVAGDFNLPAESATFREYWSGRDDAFSRAGTGYGHTKFTHWHGVRIDHILTGPELSTVHCRVGPDVRSDHRPLLADLRWSTMNTRASGGR
jgi:endonuclease/exonuclease/phosphatase (EEP) superfamily protein YafD